MELEDAVAVAAAAEEAAAAAAVNAKAWVALRIRRGGVGAACRSWAACPGRSASRKGEVEEEEGRW